MTDQTIIVTDEAANVVMPDSQVSDTLAFEALPSVSVVLDVEQTLVVAASSTPDTISIAEKPDVLHSELLGVQGGVAGEQYHISNTQHQSVQALGTASRSNLTIATEAPTILDEGDEGDLWVVI